MKANAFSYLSYNELRSLLKENPDNDFLRLECAYKNPSVTRSIHGLSKLENKLSKDEARLAREYRFFRMLKRNSIDEICIYGSSLLEEKEDELIRFIVTSLKSNILDSDKKRIIAYNHFLYFLLYYVPRNIVIDFAYSLPKDKYSEAQYIYSLFIEIYGLVRIREMSKCLRKSDKEGIRSFVNIKERETLSLIQRNPFISENEYIEFANIKGSYPTIKKLNAKEKEEILSSLVSKECVHITNDNKLEMAPGGFFLLSSFNS